MSLLLIVLNSLAATVYQIGLSSGDNATPSLDGFVTGRFLFSLWWKQLMGLAVLLAAAFLISVRVALRLAYARRPMDPNALNVAERLKELAEK